MDSFYSRDKDEIFIKVRATEENLKVQADLTDYRMQFKTRAKPSRWDFKKISPYAPFEKDKEASTELARVPTGFAGVFAGGIGKEQFFK